MQRPVDLFLTPEDLEDDPNDDGVTFGGRKNSKLKLHINLYRMKKQVKEMPSTQIISS